MLLMSESTEEYLPYMAYQYTCSKNMKTWISQIDTKFSLIVVQGGTKEGL